MHAILLTDDELSKLKLFVAQYSNSDANLKSALDYPVPDLTDFLDDIGEIIRRSRSADRYMDEDFRDFLKAFKSTRVAYKKLRAARNI